MTLIFPYYENPRMLTEHLKFWKQYPDWLKIIVVDDGSPNNPASKILSSSLKNVELYRIKKDVAWNSKAARNIGFYMANEGWVIISGIDHIFPVEIIESLTNKKLDSTKYYWFQRYHQAKKKWIHRARGTMLMTREMFWKVGGFDEALAGYYGGETAFHKNLDKVAKREMFDDLYVVYYGDTFIDATTKMKRDGSYSVWNHPELVKRIQKNRHQYKPVTFQFEWEKIELT